MPAQQLDWRLGVIQRGGFSDNVLSTTAADPSVRPVKDGFYGAEPAAALGIDFGRVRLEARYDGDLMVFFDQANGLRQWHSGRIGATLDLEPLKVSADVDVAGYNFTPFPEDAFAEVDGRLGVEVRTGPMRMSLALAAGGRFFLEDGVDLAVPRRDRELGGTLRFGAAPVSRLWLDVAYTLLDRASNDVTVDRLNHIVHADARLRLGRVDTSLGGSATLREGFESGVDVTWSGFAQVDVEVRPWLDVFGRYRLVADRTEPEYLGYVLHEVSLGVRFGASPEPPPVDSATPEPVDGGVHFRTRRPGARTVAIVGDFNGWDAAAGVMKGPDGDGAFERVVLLAPGRYEYQYLVDGNFVTPDDAIRTVPNEFGAPNGVIEVR